MKSDKSYILCNEFNKGIYKTGCYIYDTRNSKTSDPHRLLINLADKTY